MPYFIIPANIKKKLFNFLSEINNYDEIEELDFQESFNKSHLYYNHYDFFYTQDNNGKSFILIIKKGKFEFYNLEEVNEKDFLFYMLNDNYIFDCYFINFKGKEKKKLLYLKREKNI